MAETEKLGNNRTERMIGSDGKTFERAPLIAEPLTIKSGDATYVISTKLIFIGGESQIYHAEEVNTQRKCIAKIGMRNNPDRIIVNDFLRTHTDFKKYHLLPRLASGAFYVKEADDAEIQYLVDLYPYCENGDFDHSKRMFSFKALREQIIPALTTAIDTMHNSNLIHRDVKPANIYELDGEIVLGDFGITVFIDDETSGAVKTDFGRGTLGYCAPEINSHYAEKSSDYFSLGCTLATLYCGKHPYETVLAKETDFVFYKLITEKGLQMPLKKGDEALGYLIDALVQTNPSNRVGRDGILLWLQDPDEFRAKYPATYTEAPGRISGTWNKAFNFEDVECWNAQDLAREMISKWEQAKRYLYRGQVFEFFRWDQTLHNRIDQIVNEGLTATDTDLGLAYFLHYLQKGGTLAWCGSAYDQLSDISNYIWNLRQKSAQIDDKIIKMFRSKYISWKYEKSIESQGTLSENNTTKSNLENIRHIESVAGDYPEFAYYLAMYEWGETVRPDICDMDEFFKGLCADPIHFYRSIESLMTDDYTLAALEHLDGGQRVLTLKKQLGSDTRKNIRNIYLFFEAACDDKEQVRSHYYQFGPDGYLYWLQKNMSLYSFHTPEAKKLEARIKAVRFSEKMSLDELNDSIRELKLIFQPSGDFHMLFQGDFLVACLGLTKGIGRQREITATRAQAFFMDEFYGETVPNGFGEYLGLPVDMGGKQNRTQE